MLDNILNIVLLVAILFSIVYGIVIKITHKDTKAIFEVTIVAMIALFISRLFFLVLNLSSGDIHEFSVGVLGQVAGYLFLVLANRTYLPFDSEKHKFNIKAALILLIPIACYSYCLITSKTFSSIICSILYLCSTSLALYFAFKNLLLIKKDENFRQIKGFNICVMTITILSTLENLLAFITNSTVLLIVCIILTSISFVALVLSLPLLNKGVNKHDC